MRDHTSRCGTRGRNLTVQPACEVAFNVFLKALPGWTSVLPSQVEVCWVQEACPWRRGKGLETHDPWVARSVRMIWAVWLGQFGWSRWSVWPGGKGEGKGGGGGGTKGGPTHALEPAGL